MVYSTAFVLHKSSNGGLGATTTTVKSNSSGEIVLYNGAECQPWQKEIRNLSQSTTMELSNEDLKEAFKNLIKTVLEVIQLHKKDEKDYPLPLIIGLEKSVIDRNNLRDKMIEIFKGSFGELAINIEQAKKMTFDKFIKLFIQKTLEKNNLESKDIFIQVRDYLSTEEVANLGIKTNQGTPLSPEILQVESQLKTWVDQAQSGLEALRQLREYAASLGQAYARAMQQNYRGTRFLQIGIHPGGGHTWMLRRIAGPQNAFATVVFGEVLDGAEAERIGLVWKCVDDDQLLIEAQKMAARAASVPRPLLESVKKTIQDMADVVTHPEAVERELVPQLWSTKQPWFAEKIAAMQAKITKK